MTYTFCLLVLHTACTRTAACTRCTPQLPVTPCLYCTRPLSVLSHSQVIQLIKQQKVWSDTVLLYNIIYPTIRYGHSKNTVDHMGQQTIRKKIFLRLFTQYTHNFCITFVQCLTSVEDAGPTVYKCYTNIFYRHFQCGCN